MKFLSKLGRGDVILQVIRIDLHCHLEVTVAHAARSFRHNINCSIEPLRDTAKGTLEH